MTKKPISQDWAIWRIIGAVRETGTNLNRLSVSLGYSKATLKNALYGPYPKYERLIAEHLGTTPQVIWPSRYHEDGSPRSGRGERGLGRYKPKKNGSTVKKSRNVYQLNKREAM